MAAILKTAPSSLLSSFYFLSLCLNYKWVVIPKRAAHLTLIFLSRGLRNNLTFHSATVFSLKRDPCTPAWLRLVHRRQATTRASPPPPSEFDLRDLDGSKMAAFNTVHLFLFLLPVCASSPLPLLLSPLAVMNWITSTTGMSSTAGMYHSRESEFTRLTICGFLLYSLNLRLGGGGAYLCGFTPWKRWSFPSSTTEELNTSSALYLLRTSHKRQNI